MNPEIKTKWIEALRSGEFTQVHGNLRRLIDPVAPFGQEEWGFCCLGVLCELYRQETARGEFSGRSFSTPTTPDAPGFPLIYASTCFPPDPVKEWAGISQADCEMLAVHNDPVAILEFITNETRTESAYSFEEIAQLIETYL